jgi:hypothetical protein
VRPHSSCCATSAPSTRSTSPSESRSNS